MREYYDVMYSESYGWWTFAMAFDAPKKQQEALRRYEFSGMDELGVSVSCDGRRVTVAIHCHADNDSLYGARDGVRGRWAFDDFDEEDEEYEEDEEPSSATFESEDGLLNLLTRVRQQLIDGDYRALYAVWEVYGRKTMERRRPRGRPTENREKMSSRNSGPCWQRNEERSLRNPEFPAAIGLILICFGSVW